MRINLYFSETNEKDKIIVNMLKKKYSPKDYIKEKLYAIAIGESSELLIGEDINIKEEYEEIEGLDGIVI